MRQYLDLLQELLDSGNEKGDRTGTGTLSKFGHQMRFDLSEGFPLVTTKKIHLKSVIHELIWFLSGDTNVRYLRENGVSIWNEWTDEKGDLGPIYSKQWRDWTGEIEDIKIEVSRTHTNAKLTAKGIDQISEAIRLIKTDPDSRRIIVSAWNVTDLDKMALAPCHCLFQFYVHNGKLSCRLDQRSADTFLGVPFNIASYALLTHMFAQQCDLEVGDLVWQGGDTHLYLNHIEQAKLQLSRTPMPLPKLTIKRRPDSIFDYKFEDFEIVGYDPYPAIKAEVAV